MGNLAFGSQKPEKIAPQLNQHLRKEIGATWPIPFGVEGAAGGERPEMMFTVTFDCAGVRPFKLHANVERQGVGARVGELCYSTTLRKNIGAAVELTEPKMFGLSQFAGDAAASGRLNANGKLRRRANRFSRQKTEIGGLTLTAPRFFKIVPQEGGALFVANTLGAPKWFGFRVSLGAKEFLALAAAIEAAL